MNNPIQGVNFLSKKKPSVRSTMLHVVAALVPGTLLYAAIIDTRILFNLALACLVALCCEFLCLKLRDRPVVASLSDGSIVLAAWLLVLCLPPSLPAWQISVGVIVLVTLGKHVFGGLGQNPFNPAMVAYAFLLVSFPITMTAWDLNQHVDDRTASSTAAGMGKDASAGEDSDMAVNTHSRLTDWDGVTGATALDRLRELKRDSSSGRKAVDLSTSQRGASSQTSSQTSFQTELDSRTRHEIATKWITGSSWVWINVAWLLGGLYLLALRIITWHIPLSVLLAISSVYAIANLTGLTMGLPIIPALLSGGIILGAFFIATDPVSAAASRQGQLVYGCGIGILAVVIREFSVFPEGIAFAVLLMNMCVPLIDYLSTGKQGKLTSGGTRK